MFGLGMSELMLIAVIALVVVGPKKLPEIAKSVGKGYGEFRRNLNDLKQSVDLEQDINPTRGSQAQQQDYAENYRSQWEQKLTPPAVEAKQDVVASNNDEGNRG